MIRRERYVSELEEELRLHVQLRAEAMQAAGLTAEQASAEARRRFGNVTNTTEASREVWGFGTLDQLLQDVRFAARRLRARPGLSAPVIVVLALGIGATTAVFSAVDAAMLRSLPFPRDHELVTLTNVNVPFALEGGERNQGRLLDLSDVAAMTDVFSGVAAYASGGLNLSDPDGPQRVSAGVVTTGFFETLGATPLAGRVFTAEEGVPNGPPAVILSHALWRRQFGGAPMVGKSIPLHGRPHTVVGIMRPGFDFLGESDLWIPMSVPTTFATFEPFRGFLPSHVVARMRPGVTAESAGTHVLSRWLQVVQPASGPVTDGLKEWVDEVRTKGPVIPLHRQLLGDRRPALLVLLGATALLLLIACANVANLLLSDASTRKREIAVREVLGATRQRIVRQLLAESVLLAIAGGVAGILLAPAELRILRAMMPPSLAGVATAQLDLRVLGFAAVLAIATSIVFGLWPAIGATRGDANAAIKSGGGHGATAGIGKVRRALLVVEFALTAMLLIAAGLMIRSFGRLMAEDTGMNPEQVATLETSFPRTMPEPERLRIVGSVLDRLSAQPGIVATGAVNDLPLRGGGGISLTIDVPGAPPLPEGEYRMARFLYASQGYFATMGIPLLRGRTFTASDAGGANGPHVAVISNTMAAKNWPGVDPVGRHFTLRSGTTRIMAIGVAADGRELGRER